MDVFLCIKKPGYPGYVSVEHICEYLFPYWEQFKYTIISFKSKVFLIIA